MGFEALSENIEWEARRVVAAFGASSFRETSFEGIGKEFEARLEIGVVLWRLESDGTLRSLCLYSELNLECLCVFYDHLPNHAPGKQWWVDGFSQKYIAPMARAIYRLGLQDEAVLRALNHPLTAHEKLELRLSMPREFWPKEWLQEEGA